MTGTPIRRRDVLKAGAALAASGAVGPSFGILRAGESPNEKLNVALMGVGARGVHLYTKMFGDEDLQKHVNYVCFADPNERSRQRLYGHPVRDEYAREFDKRFGHLPYYRDYRRMLDKHDREIDAVIVATTYGANFTATRWTIEMGKHAYTEKPIGITVEEARQMPEIVRRTRRVTQMGNHGASRHGPAMFRNWVEGGVFGPVRELHVAIAQGPHRLKHLPTDRPGKPVPETFDWDVFLGVEPRKPFPGMDWVEGQKGWASVVGFGTGLTGNWGTHCCTGDVPALQLKNPTSLTLVECQPADREHAWNVIVEYAFPERGGLVPMKVRMYLGGKDFLRSRMPIPEDLEPDRRERLRMWNLHIIVGDRATAICENYNDGLRIVPESRMQAMIPEVKNVPETYTRARYNHFRSWVEACRAGDPHAPRANWHDSAGALMEFLNLGHVVMRRGAVGKTLLWDADRMRFTNDEQATRLLSRPYRKEYVNWT
ncbi:MAG: Gfo/Idh/MocA family oxidoreductase [Phycisphaerae bacterium]